MSDHQDEAVVHLSPELRESLARKRPAMVVAPKADPLEDIAETLGLLMASIGSLHEKVDRIEAKMGDVQQIALIVKEQVQPVMNEITEGPIGRMLGIKKGR